MTTTAYAPGSVTTVFVPRPDHDEGSLGVSFAVADGVTVTVDTTQHTRVTLDGDETSIEPVTRVLDRLAIDATVDIETDVPIGCGFGVSGAATLATAIAANTEHDLGHDHPTLLDAAHHAELAAGTGQGDVFIQSQGGFLWNTGSDMGHTARDDPIAYAANGSIDTSAVLADADATDRIATAGQPALDSFDPDMPLEDWFTRSWEFAQTAGVTTDWIQDTVTAVETAGGAATMAMLGDTVIATPGTDVLTEETTIHPDGATLL